MRKGIVHSKMKILSSFTHSQVLETQFRFSVPLFLDFLLFDCMDFQWTDTNLPRFIKIFLFLFGRLTKVLWAWNNMRVNKLMTDFYILDELSI